MAQGCFEKPLQFPSLSSIFVKDSILNRDMEEDMLHQIGVVPVPYDDLNDPVVSLLTY